MRDGTESRWSLCACACSRLVFRQSLNVLLFVHVLAGLLGCQTEGLTARIEREADLSVLFHGWKGIYVLRPTPIVNRQVDHHYVYGTLWPLREVTAAEIATIVKALGRPCESVVVYLPDQGPWKMRAEEEVPEFVRFVGGLGARRTLLLPFDEENSIRLCQPEISGSAGAR